VKGHPIFWCCAPHWHSRRKKRNQKGENILRGGREKSKLAAKGSYCSIKTKGEHQGNEKSAGRKSESGTRANHLLLKRKA